MRPPPLLRSPLILGLVLANVALLGSLAARHLPASRADAQAAVPGDYVMLAGEAQGIPGEVVYIHDTRNGGVMAVGLDTSAGTLTSLPPVNINRVLDNAGAIR